MYYNGGSSIWCLYYDVPWQDTTHDWTRHYILHRTQQHHTYHTSLPTHARSHRRRSLFCLLFVYKKYTNPPNGGFCHYYGSIIVADFCPHDQMRLSYCTVNTIWYEWWYEQNGNWPRSVTHDRHGGPCFMHPGTGPQASPHYIPSSSSLADHLVGTSAAFLVSGRREATGAYIYYPHTQQKFLILTFRVEFIKKPALQ